MKVVFVNTMDDPNPSGGIKQAYRHIDILNQLGIPASFVHPTPNFRQEWFENKTRTELWEDVELTADDFMIFSELVDKVPQVRGWDRCRKVIFCQNDYNVHVGFKSDIAEIKRQYRDSAVLCVSQNSQENLQFLFPEAKVYRVRPSFDRPPWGFSANKDQKVVMLPRKRGMEIGTILTMAKIRGMPKGWDIFSVGGVSEKEVAEAFKRNRIFLSLSQREGFGLPPAEAMACGCVVVGYTGYGGDEFMLPGISYPVPDGDFISLTRSLVDVFSLSPEALAEIGHKASTFIRATYSTEAEVNSIRSAWSQITRPVIEIADEKPDEVVPVVKINRIKAVIMHHNKPENADKLFEQLAPIFDDVEIFDNGSDPEKVPVHVTRARENVYWTGTVNEVIETCQQYDAVWVIGCDVELINKPEEYREAIESSLPFGCWSPSIEGRAHPFMQASNFTSKKSAKVKNLEGMAIAISGSLMKQVGELVPGSQIGFGQDFWLCYRSRKAGMSNVLDGRVMVHHPEGIGYDEVEASRQMEDTFARAYGPDFRNSIFEYDQRFEKNLVGGSSMTDGKKFVIVTVDNGWGLSEFLRITNSLDARRIIMCKGVLENAPEDGVEYVPYDSSLDFLIKSADAAFFPRVGEANKDDYLKLLKAGVATVVRESCSQGAIEHEKTGWEFRDEKWAIHWLAYLKDHPEVREQRRKTAEAVPESTPVSGQVVVAKTPERAVVRSGPCLVTVITPTYHRDLKVIRRCIDCMLLQTETDWEQIICSDGENEPLVKALVDEVADPRIRYEHTEGKKENDFGNTVRDEMLKKARGKFILFFDDDNLILPHYLQTMIRAISESNKDYAVCKIMHFGPLHQSEGKAPKVLTGNPVKLYHIDPLQVLVRTKLMQSIGWDKTVGYLSDGVTLERLGAKSDPIWIEEVLGIHM